MPNRDPQAIREKLGQTTLKVDSFFLRRTGFIAAQTILKLGEYNLNCVPASIGLTEGRFLAVLTPAEVGLFAKYKTGIHILILTFDDPDNNDIARYHLRVVLADLQPVPGRKNVCFLSLKFKALPAEFVLFLGAYQEELEARQESWEKWSAQVLEFSPQLAVAVGAGIGFILVSGETRVSVEILSFHTKLVQLKFQEGTPEPPSDVKYQLKLAFQGRPLLVEGTLKDAGVFIPDFNPEWLTFVEDSHFQQDLSAHSKAKPK